MTQQKPDIKIKNYLPHEKPMLMVDSIDHMTMEEVTTNFHISNDCIFLDNNQLSETGLIENAAQTCSAISGQHYFTDGDPIATQVIGFISSIKKITLYSLPTQGMTIKTKARQISLLQNPHYSICTFRVQVYHLSTVFLEGEINLFLQKSNHEKE